MQPLDQYPELAAAAAALPGCRLQAAARRLAMLSAARTREEGLGNASIAELQDRVNQLDSVAYDLRDRADEGEPGQTDAYDAMFRRARAADSWLALQLGEVSRSIYESLHALGADHGVVLAELEAAGGSRP